MPRQKKNSRKEPCCQLPDSGETWFIVFGIVAISLIAAFFVFMIQPLSLLEKSKVSETRNSPAENLPIMDVAISAPAAGNAFSPNLSLTTPACIDNDGGKNPLKSGSSSFCERDASGNETSCYRKNEYCATGEINTLVEYFCSTDRLENPTISQELIQCGAGYFCENNKAGKGARCVKTGCSTNNDCPKTFSCVTTPSGDKTCAPPSCTIDEDCPDEFTCNSEKKQCELAVTPSVSLTCADSDPLNNPYRIGVVNYTEEQSTKQQVDDCANQQTVNEYACKDGKLTSAVPKSCPSAKNYTDENVQSTCKVVSTPQGESGAKCVFSCTEDAACPRSMKCQDGICIPPSTCQTNNDCEDGEQCTAGLCIKPVEVVITPKKCSPQTPCPQGQECSRNGVCVKRLISACEDNDPINDAENKGTVYIRETNTRKEDHCTGPIEKINIQNTNNNGITELSVTRQVQQYACSAQNTLEILTPNTCEGALLCNNGQCGCIDTDPGNKTNVAGAVFARDSLALTGTPDTCLPNSTTYVIEYECGLNGRLSPQIKPCPQGTTCNNGICR
jgi:hypothetical protein